MPADANQGHASAARSLPKLDPSRIFEELTGRNGDAERLELNDRQLSSLPESIGQLTQLKELWLGQNQLV